MTKLAAPDRQPKGERTREHILATALVLFAKQGYTATTMRDIATTAQCSLGLAYHYFANKEALVLALYQQIASTIVEETATLPSTSVAERFVAIMRLKLALLMPYRTAFGAWFGAALTPNSGIAVLGPETAEIRTMMLEVFHQVVGQATDAPHPQQAQDLTLILYVLHLALIFVWLHDRSPDQQAAMKLLNLSYDTLRRLRWFLRLPPVARLLARLAEALQPLIQGSA